MKKMLLATAVPAYYRMCSTDVYCSNKPAAVAPKTITHHFFVSGIGQKKTVDAAKFVAAQKIFVKTETQQTFVNGLLGFITLGIYTPLEARVCSQYYSCHRYGQLYLHCSLITATGSFQLFLQSASL